MKRIVARLAARELTQSEMKQVSGGEDDGTYTYMDTTCTSGEDKEGISITITDDSRQYDINT